MEQTDFIVIGSGIAGARAAIELSRHGEVVVLTKSKADESNTEYAQGGIAVAMHDEDRIGLHYEDTIRAGDGLCNEAAVKVLVEEGPDRIKELIEWGTEFDREGVKLAFSREAAHSRRRILHAHGDATGREVNRTLIRKMASLPQIHVHPYALAYRLLTGSDGCEGVSYLEERTGKLQEIRARSVLLATGGVGMVYRDTTNPDIATGDGYGLAFWAGACLADMEFVQFHPTALKLKGAPRFLLTEALRGEGGRLRNPAGELFMKNYHPLADLAPRDVVSRAIFTEANRVGSDYVYLDMTDLDPNFVRERFPGVYSNCLRFGLDISREPIPVFPAAHYMMGGVYTDVFGRTTIPRLFAGGEVACTGVHGANRLASNSLLEGLVYGARAGKTMTEAPAAAQFASSPLEVESVKFEKVEGPGPGREAVQKIMTADVSIERSASGLKRAIAELKAIPLSSRVFRPDQEVNNLLAVATLIARAALLREESRGGHYRTDYPEPKESWRRRILRHYDSESDRLITEALQVSRLERLEEQ